MDLFWISQVSLVIPGYGSLPVFSKLDTGLRKCVILVLVWRKIKSVPSMTDKPSACRAFTVVRTAALNPSCQLHIPDLDRGTAMRMAVSKPSVSMTCGISCIINDAACLEAAHNVSGCVETNIFFNVFK